MNKKYKVLQVVFLIPFMIPLLYALYSSVFGISIFCQSYVGDKCPIYYGFKAFFYGIMIYTIQYWPTYIIGIILFIVIKKRKK